MCDLSYLDFVENQYLLWEQAAREDLEQQLQQSLNLPLAMLPTDLCWRIIESPAPDFPSDCDVNASAYACGFVDENGIAL